MKVGDIASYVPITGSAISPCGRWAAVVTPVLDGARKVERLWCLDLDARDPAWRRVGGPDAAFHGVTFLNDGRLAAFREEAGAQELVVVDPEAPGAARVVAGMPPGAIALKPWGPTGLGCLGADDEGVRRVWGWADPDAVPRVLTPARQPVGDWVGMGVSDVLTWIWAPHRGIGAPAPRNVLLRSGEPPTPIELPENPLGYLTASPDGRRLALLTRPHDEVLTQPRLWVAEDGVAVRWLAGQPGWITGLDWRGESLTVAVDVGVDGWLLRASGPEACEAIGGGPVGYDTGPRSDRSGRRTLFLRQDGHVPQHLRFVENGVETRLTQFNQRLEASPLRPAERVTWAAPDGTSLEGLLYLPEGEGPHRLVVWLHGGPAEHLQRTFSAPFQALLAAGVGVFAPNFRGSTGRDDAFLQKLRGGLCTADVADVEAGVRRLIVAGAVHRRRVAVMGWSYGASLALAVAAACPWVRAVVAGAPVADWLSVFGARAWPWVTRAWFPGEPWETPAAYDAASPARRLGQVQAPTLLLHGEVDDRVPLSQSRLVYHLLTARGVVTDLRVFPGEGHLLHAPWAVHEAWGRALAWALAHTSDG